MEKAENNCPGCGAPVSSVICPYCGTLTTHLEDVEAERRALEAFHRLLGDEKDEEKQGALLQHGFIPQHLPNLINAGLRCATFTGGWKTSSSEPTASALTRLRSLVIRLKITPETPETRLAIQEFETILQKQNQIDRQALIAGISMVVVPILVGLGAILGLAYWVAQLLR